MLTYYLDIDNTYTIRTMPTSSNSFTLVLQDMTELRNEEAILSDISYDGYESMLTFEALITSASIGAEYRATLIDNGVSQSIWNGSIQVYSSQSIDKPVYKTQNDQYISHDSTNEYIIM